jgi:hypothetical protein
LRGFVDRAGPEVVSGWAQSETYTEIPVSLVVLVDGRRVASVLADRFRADLRAAGLGSGKHAFEVVLPTGVRGRVEVRRTLDQAPLALTEAAVDVPKNSSKAPTAPSNRTPSKNPARLRRLLPPAVSRPA